MTEGQRKRMAKLMQGAMEDLQMHSASEERKMIESMKEVAHTTRMMYEAYLGEGFNDEQAMFLTTSAIEAILIGGRI